MNLETHTRYQLTFDFSYLSDVFDALKNYPIIHQSFSEDVTIITDLPKESEQFIIYNLLVITFKQIKVKVLKKSEEDFYPEEKGTDKPLGSKSAIDEN